MGTFNYADDPSRMSKTVRLFKTLAQNPHVPVDDIVYQGPQLQTSRNTCYERIYDFRSIFDNDYIRKNDYQQFIYMIYLFFPTVYAIRFPIVFHSIESLRISFHTYAYDREVTYLLVLSFIIVSWHWYSLRHQSCISE